MEMTTTLGQQRPERAPPGRGGDDLGRRQRIGALHPGQAGLRRRAWSR